MPFKLMLNYSVWRENTIFYLTHIFACSLSSEITVQTLLLVHLLSVRIPLSFCFIVRFVHQKIK